MASANNSMNKFEANFMKDNQDQNTSEQLDGAPSWMLPLFAKMKAEIKKEIMEEVMTLISKSHKKSKDKVSIDKIFEEIYCDHCDQLIVGVRYKCGNCEDFDLCQDCESIPNVHDPSHIFLKIRYPLAVKCKHKKNKNYANQSFKKLDSSLLAKELVDSNIPKEHVGWLLSKVPTKPYDAQYMCDETFPDASIVSPSTKFIKCWRVLNSGTKPWTNEVKLRCLRDTKLVPESYQVNVPPLKPGKVGVVSVLLSTPSKPGIYQCHWQFYHNNIAFGHNLWCKVQVIIPDSDEQTDKKEDKKNQTNWDDLMAPFLFAANDQAKGNLPRKLVVSHTATPNNTPFDITPPKSPDHHETSIKEIPELSNNVVITRPKSNQGSDDDDCSILSISSDSETEFVVIPRPKCFNLSESFVSHQFSHLSPHLISKSLALENVEYEKNNSANQLSTQGNNSRMPNTSGPVSQETGVPELAENVVETKLEVVQEENQEKTQKIFVSRLSADGSSSEISIIESEDNSPVIENITQTRDTLSITVSDGNTTPNVSKNNTSSIEDNRINLQIEQKEIENESSSAHSNVTFPKYPIEGISESETFIPKDEERTIQVLPEGLVTGALSAAASFYNTAKAVISTMQQPHNEKDICLSRDLPIRNQEDNHNPIQNVKPSSVEHLIEMGFCNRQQNEELLKKHHGDMAAVVGELVSLNDNEWYESRHASQITD